MPAYTFSCERCGHHWEITHKINEQHPTACPNCKAKKIKRTFEMPAIHFARQWVERDRTDVVGGHGRLIKSK